MKQVPNNPIEIAAELGITYRRLDYWIRCGYLHSEPASPGSGFPRSLSSIEIRIAEMMVRLMMAGLTVEGAAIAARRMVFDDTNSTTLPGGVTIQIGEVISGT